MLPMFYWCIIKFVVFLTITFWQLLGSHAGLRCVLFQKAAIKDFALESRVGCR